MDKPRILIVGDSFCAPTLDHHTWYRYLESKYTVDNRGQAGVGQFKIHQQLASDKPYQVIIYLITSPYRIHSERNPFYDLDHPSHSNCDLIYEDVKSRLPDPASQHILWWFENVFDTDQALFVHDLIVNHDCKKHTNVLPISFFDCSHISDLDVLQLDWIWKSNSGDVNHLSQLGHRLVFEQIVSRLEKFC